MEQPKRRYTKAGGMTARHADLEFINYWSAPDSDLFSVKCASAVLKIRKQMVVKLELPRHMIEKRAYYRKGDIQALLMADQIEPNKLLRDLQENHRQVQIKQQKHPSTSYKSVTGTLLPHEKKAAKQASKANRKKPPTRDEVFGGWGSSVSRNKPVPPAKPLSEEEVRYAERMSAWARKELKLD